MNTCEKSSFQHMFLHVGNEVFEAFFFNQKITKSHLIITFCLFFRKKILKIHPYITFCLFLNIFFAKIPFIIHMTWICTGFFATSFFKKTLLQFFLSSFSWKNLAKNSAILRILIFQKQKNYNIPSMKRKRVSWSNKG